MSRVVAISASVLLLISASSASASEKSSHKTTSASQKHAPAKKNSTSTHVKSTSSHTPHSKHGKKVHKASWKSHGQHGIDADRTRQIQEALIRENYLNGEADGDWDARTQDAMRRYQEANGWQSKVLPDSRALIKLGLGPDHTQVLNPETAAVSPYATTNSGTVTPASVSNMQAATPTVREQY